VSVWACVWVRRRKHRWVRERECVCVCVCACVYAWFESGNMSSSHTSERRFRNCVVCVRMGAHARTCVCVCVRARARLRLYLDLNMTFGELPFPPFFWEPVAPNVQKETWESFPIRMSNITFMMSHVSYQRGTSHMNESRLIWRNHVSYECPMRMSRMNESRLIWMSRVSNKRVKSRGLAWDAIDMKNATSYMYVSYVISAGLCRYMCGTLLNQSHENLPHAHSTFVYVSCVICVSLSCHQCRSMSIYV